MIRLIATDLDGTLLNAASALTPRTLRALRAVMARGVYVSLSSGRMMEAMLSFASEIGVNAPMILYNGAMIYDTRSRRTLFSNIIPHSLAVEVCRAMEEMGLYYQAYPGEGYYCRERTKYTRLYEESIRVPCQPVAVPISQWLQTGAIKLLAIDSAERIDEARALLSARFPSGVRFMKSRDTFLEVVAEGIDKAAALRALAAQLNVPISEVLAFGDGQNDAGMLRAAGIGVAMENADALCKQAADRFAEPNTRDGVARFIEEGLETGLFGEA
ncbi:MAG: HAD family phosphatase [Clostridia bacterium]|nr:HAD family phosphatase [Clostridia bacterium]